MNKNPRADFDLDNIRLASTEAGADVLAEYVLTHILLEGHCFDDDTGNPPRGLQYVLGTKSQPRQFDTVFNNKKYIFFSSLTDRDGEPRLLPAEGCSRYLSHHSAKKNILKIKTGVWTLRLREGKSRDVYALRGSPDAGGSIADDWMNVLVDSFSGKTVHIRVKGFFSNN